MHGEASLTTYIYTDTSCRKKNMYNNINKIKFKQVFWCEPCWELVMVLLFCWNRPSVKRLQPMLSRGKNSAVKDRAESMASWSRRVWQCQLIKGTCVQVNNQLSSEKHFGIAFTSAATFGWCNGVICNCFTLSLLEVFSKGFRMINTT